MKRILFLFASLTLLSISSFGNSVQAKKIRFHGDSIKITVPNVFTPNNDYKNDTWSIIVTDGIEVFDLETKIYNRWGQKVFESTNTHQHWNGYNLYNGNECASDTYFYVISYTDGNTNQTKTLKGFIEIVR